MGLITSFTRPGRVRLPYAETTGSFAGSSVAFAFAANVLQLMHMRFDRPITFRYGHIFVATAAGDVEFTIWTSDGTNLNRQAASGAVAAAGTNAVQALDLGASFTPIIGQDYWFGLGIGSNTLRIGTGAGVNYAGLALTQFAPAGAVGRYRTRTSVTPPAGTQYTIASLGTPAQPAPWIIVIDGV